MTRFVSAFTNAETGAPQDLDFWGRICHREHGGSGPSYLGGWITAFCVWDSSGEWMGPPASAAKPSRTPDDSPSFLELDGISYAMIETGKVPVAFTEVEVRLIDNDEEFECMMVSGHVGSSVEGERGDTIRPLPAWFMFTKEERKARDAEF